jgi:hypothetical protein
MFHHKRTEEEYLVFDYPDFESLSTDDKKPFIMKSWCASYDCNIYYGQTFNYPNNPNVNYYLTRDSVDSIDGDRKRFKRYFSVVKIHGNQIIKDFYNIKDYLTWSKEQEKIDL